MIGIVLVAHGQLGAELLKAAELIIGSQQKCHTVAIEMNLSPDYLSDMIAKAIKLQDNGRGVLIITDMFGGTPTNISLSFHEDGKVEVITGANLPMLLKAIEYRKKPDVDLRTLAKVTLDYALKSIYIASDMLRGPRK
ncbi:MAG: PTS sugar transporter subunit IIA [Deltaproteobacteria bacterium]|jgi:PTS system mannose-specific IIA component|nr:PTS sugar transporter subunit IIA [Deltaproteobacteria bacterium]